MQRNQKSNGEKSKQSVNKFMTFTIKNHHQKQSKTITKTYIRVPITFIPLEKSQQNFQNPINKWRKTERGELDCEQQLSFTQNVWHGAPAQKMQIKHS